MSAAVVAAADRASCADAIAAAAVAVLERAHGWARLRNAAGAGFPSAGSPPERSDRRQTGSPAPPGAPQLQRRTRLSGWRAM